MRTTQKFFWALVAASILFAACATKFSSVWKDEAYQGYPARIMIVGVSETPVMRRLVEDEFVKELKARDTDAIESYPVLPGPSLADRAAIEAKAGEAGADTVIIMTLVGRKTETSESTWTTYLDKYVDMKTDIYDLKSRKKIWSASSETWINENVSNEARIRSFVKAVIRKLLEQKLLRPIPPPSNIDSN
jgi:hypothetical protein